jgi:hypothetical protein
MPQDPQKVALYCQGTFDIPNPTPAQLQQMLAAADDIGKSGFGTVILGQWHVHEDGSIYYNNTPVSQVAEALQQIPVELKKGGNVKNVLITFGPFATDFQAIQDNLATFKSTMGAIATQNQIDGFDWDLEENLETFTNLLVDITQWANSLGKIVTAAPYYDSSFWTTVLKQTNTGGDSGFAWWNLQLYGGAYYPTWVPALQGLVPSPESFLVPGYSVVDQQSPPAQIQQDLATTQASFPALDGGFIWKYEALAPNGYTTQQVGQAIVNGLNGVPTPSPTEATAGSR